MNEVSANISTETQFLNYLGLQYQDVITQLGDGAIYLVYSRQYNCSFALKSISQKAFCSSEIECFQILDDPCIVSLYQYFSFDGKVYLLMEYCHNDLDRYLKTKPRMNNEDILVLCYNVARAIKSCHDRGIAHGDIKPSNILLDKYGRVKINDFRSASISQGEKINKFKGTRYFEAPEIIDGMLYDPIKADIWALGVTFYIIATNTLPFQSYDNEQLKAKIKNGTYSEYKISDPCIKQLIRLCLDRNPESRPSIQTIIELPFFNFAQAKNQENMRLIRNDPLGKSHYMIIKPKAGRNKLSAIKTLPKSMSYIPKIS